MNSVLHTSQLRTCLSLGTEEIPFRPAFDCSSYYYCYDYDSDDAAAAAAVLVDFSINVVVRYDHRCCARRKNPK